MSRLSWPVRYRNMLVEFWRNVIHHMVQKCRIRLADLSLRAGHGFTKVADSRCEQWAVAAKEGTTSKTQANGSLGC